MDLLSIAIIIFIIMESANVAILYFWPGSRLGNGVAVFNAYFNPGSEEQRLFTSYLVNWVAGVKLIFIFLLAVILVLGTEQVKLWGVVAMILSIATYFWRLHPHHQKAGRHGLYHPQGLLQGSGLDDHRISHHVLPGFGGSYPDGGDVSMKATRMSRRKKWLLAGGIVLLILAILAGAFFWYVSDYYKAEDVALEVLAQDSGITVQDNLTILSPSQPTDTAIIFYPGAKVEAEAYLPLLDQIRQTGVTCILVHMPFHMAIFDANAAEEVMAQFPEYQHWYMAGHSMGGAMASKFSADHPDQVDGLILMGAYIYGDYPAEKTLTIYGSLNQSVEDHIDYTENIVEIEGGNHAQFGNYGPQKGDLPATISAQEQQAQTVAAIEAFLG